MGKATNVITDIKGNSIASELDIEPGDILLSINDQEVNDIIDYKYLISDEYIEVSIIKPSGEEWIFEIEKEYDEDLGLEFKNSIIDGARSCANKCIFCFIDQLPKNMRDTLYFKDDDSRLSFLQGNFITMTNMSDKDIDRIIRYRISPLNISVHTTDPDLRIMMLGNKRAGNIMKYIDRLCSGGIEINCQIVLCRDINDGDNLKKTALDLFSYHPNIKNVAVVPVGISRYREKLYPLTPYDKESSSRVIDIIEKLQNEFYDKKGNIFIRAADEFYIMADRDMPNPKCYGEYEQLEDGIGMISYFLENIDKALKEGNNKKVNKTISSVTGMSAYKYIKSTCEKIERNIDGLKINVYPIKNNFFGEKITVTGLLTGKDIVEQLKGKELGEKLFLPSNTLKSGENVLLDDYTIKGIENELNIDIEVCNFDGSDFVKLIAL